MAAALLALSLAACRADRPKPPHVVPGGDPVRGRMLLAEFGCGACHVIRGVPGAEGLTGPPLDDFGNRLFIAGTLQNTAENLILFIAEPQAVEPGTVMPDVGVSPDQARDMAAYLYQTGRAAARGTPPP